MRWKPQAFPGRFLYVSATAPAGGDGSAARPFSDLQQAIRSAPSGSTLLLSAGTFTATPSSYLDTCGNCSFPAPATATRGFIITARSIELIGDPGGGTVLSTGAGHGVFIEDACEVHLKQLTVTGGTRDPDGQASNAAVYVRRSRAVLDRVTIRDNKALMPNNAYPGIIGVVGREDSDVLILGSRIQRNSWDGVTAYSGGRIRIYNSVISDGNGVGVGITFTGKAQVISTEIYKYWKGIGAFVDAKVEAYNNLIHDQYGWGMWATQNAELIAVNNTLAYNDMVGVSLGESNTKGRFENNIVAFNGLNRYRRYATTTFGQTGYRGVASSSSPFRPQYNALNGNLVQDWVLPNNTTVVPQSAWGTGSLAVNPLFVSATDFRLQSSSPMKNQGNPLIKNGDGSRSDLGFTGGPLAGATGP